MMVPWFMLMCAVVNFSLEIWTTPLMRMGLRSVLTYAGKILCIYISGVQSFIYCYGYFAFMGQC